MLQLTTLWRLRAIVMDGNMYRRARMGSPLKKQEYIAIDCGYVSQLLRKASIQTIRKAYAAKGFDLVALLDPDFTPLGAVIDSPHRRAVSAVKTM